MIDYGKYYELPENFFLNPEETREILKDPRYFDVFKDFFDTLFEDKGVAKDLLIEWIEKTDLAVEICDYFFPEALNLQAEKDAKEHYNEVSRSIAENLKF